MPGCAKPRSALSQADATRKDQERGKGILLRPTISRIASHHSGLKTPAPITCLGVEVVGIDERFWVSGKYKFSAQACRVAAFCNWFWQAPRMPLTRCSGNHRGLLRLNDLPRIFVERPINDSDVKAIAEANQKRLPLGQAKP